MPQRLYGLFVGIDAYESPVPPLRGCVNDVHALETLLRERLAGERFELKLRVLTDSRATRQAVIDGFRKHLAQAGREDVALFYFSGHGSQEPAPPEFWHIEPDRLNETLVCYDSRRVNEYDLADKELAQLIAALASRGPHVVVILDCCHSGSGTRASQDTGVRRAPSDSRARPLEHYAITPAGAAELRAVPPLHLSKGRHLVLSACRDYEEAREATLGGEPRGVFSYFLTEALAQYGAGLTYRDLYKRVNALVRARAATQSPILESSDLADLNLLFLGGAMGPRVSYFTASYSKSDGWCIDGGAVHGLSLPVEDETTHLALFPIHATAQELGHTKYAVGAARVTERLPARSKITLDFDAPHDQTYKAFVTATPLPPLAVRLEGDAAGVAVLRKQIADSLLVREEESGEELVVTARLNAFRIRRAGEARSLAVDAVSANDTAQRLEQMARWLRIAGLSNPTSALRPDAVQMEITDAAGTPLALEQGELRLTYKLREGTWHRPSFKIRLTNKTRRRLYCMLLDLPETFSVSSALLPGGGQWIEPEAEIWALEGKPIYARIPVELQEAGMIELRDLLKLVVSTEECDATLLEQPDLDVAFTPSVGSRGAPIRNTLNRLMRRVQTRHCGAASEDDEITDWAVSEIAVTTVRPRDGVPVAALEGTAVLGSGVALMGHARLRANARLTTAPVAMRTAGTTELPPLLSDHPEVVEPFEMSFGSGGEAGLSVLELLDVEDHEAVTPDAPLRLSIDRPLATNESILAVAREGNLFLPLGRVIRRSEGVEIVLDRLPMPETQDARNLIGSIRIYFEKVIVHRFGSEFRYPLLAAVRYDSGAVRRESNSDCVRDLVAEADRILLFIHGILGDTEGMAASAFAPPDGVAPVADAYDLVLTFDYENINTPIEEIARSLSTRLDAVGLRPGHDKTLDIVAHSMGGLISRWYIECEGGKATVRRLVMLGTPNAGSNWSSLQNWATTALGIAINGLGVVAWPIQVLGAVMNAVEDVDVTLDQMAPDSDLLRALAASPDPGVPYRIVAGNTNIIAALDHSLDDRSSLLSRLVRRLAPRQLMHNVSSIAFFGQPNDTAVSVRSISSLPAGRVPPPLIEEVACDHVTYFATAAGQRALARALA